MRVRSSRVAVRRVLRLLGGTSIAAGLALLPQSSPALAAATQSPQAAATSTWKVPACQMVIQISRASGPCTRLLRCPARHDTPGRSS